MKEKKEDNHKPPKRPIDECSDEASQEALHKMDFQCYRHINRGYTRLNCN